MLDATLALLRQIYQDIASLFFPIKGNKNVEGGKSLVNNCVSVIRTTSGEERCSLCVPRHSGILSWRSNWQYVTVFVTGIAGNGKGKVPACLCSMFSILHCKETATALA